MLGRLGRPRDGGEGALSYLAVILLVASITAAITVVAVPDTVAGGIKGGLCRVVGQRCDPESSSAGGTATPQPSGTAAPRPGGGTATPAPGGTPTPGASPGTEGQPADPELQAALDALNRAEGDESRAQDEWDAFSLLEALKEIGLDFLIGDIKRCIENPNIGDCLWALISIIPWGKIGKLIKSIPKIAKLIDRFLDLQRALDRARDARVAARSNLDRVLRTKINDALARACPQNSFVAGTSVRMADGDRRPIERLRPGDRVLAGDPVTGRTRAETVTAAFSGTRYTSLVRVTIDVDGDRGFRTGTLTATEHHRFWDASAVRWVRADELTGASTLRTPTGDGLRVLRAVHLPGHPPVYDLTVANLHTFYVQAGDAAVLVHNEAPGCIALSMLPGPGNRYRSPAGLVYGEGSAEGHRIMHVLDHGRENPSKPLHSVFKHDQGVLDYVDEAWSKRHNVTPIPQGNRMVYIIPMGRTVGTQGEKYIRVVVENGSEVVTAFPQKTGHL